MAGLLILLSILSGLKNRHGLAYFDESVLQIITSYRLPALTVSMHVVTNILAPFTLGVMAFAGGILWVKRTKELWRPGLLALAMTLAFVSSFVIKNLTMRARPPFTDRILPFELNYSFPSGHVLTLTTLLLVLGYLWYSRRPSHRHLAIWIAVTTSGTLLIAFSRIYLGYHWLSDVSASVGLAFIILAVILTIDYFKPQITTLFKHLKK